MVLKSFSPPSSWRVMRTKLMPLNGGFSVFWKRECEADAQQYFTRNGSRKSASLVSSRPAELSWRVTRVFHFIISWLCCPRECRRLCGEQFEWHELFHAHWSGRPHGARRNRTFRGRWALRCPVCELEELNTRLASAKDRYDGVYHDNVFKKALPFPSYLWHSGNLDLHYNALECINTYNSMIWKALYCLDQKKSPLQVYSDIHSKYKMVISSDGSQPKGYSKKGVPTPAASK